MKKCKFFGTDGIRGVIGQDFDAELAARIANAAAVYVGARPAKVVIGWDTRGSCDFIVHILAGTLAYYGIDVLKVGVVPTAALSFLTHKLGCDIGVMVSASHSSAKYNGVKIFNSAGEKLSERETCEFDKLVAKKSKPEQRAANIGTITTDAKAIKFWQNYLVRKYKNLVKPGMKIAVDCAFGSGAECARVCLGALGLCATIFNDKSDGFNINDGCGATQPAYMRAAMRDDALSGGFDIGFAFDGDADRCIVFDAEGNHIHGDIVIYLLAKHYKNRGALAKNKIASTILFNLGIENVLRRDGIKLVRTDVGDAEVCNALKSENLAMGGEPSGHIIFQKVWCTGDGLVLALEFLAMLAASDKSLADLCRQAQVYPQVNLNTDATPAQKKFLFKNSDFKKFINSAKDRYCDERIIVRPSGTENIVRVTAEGAEKQKCETIAAEIVAEIKRILQNA